MATRRSALQHATKLIEGRDRTEAQLRSALERKGYDPAEIDAAIEQLKRLRYVDDQRVAAAKARTELSAHQSRATATRKIAAMGVGETVAQAATANAQIELGHDDERAARALLAKRRLTGLKAARFLASRGFDEALIRRLVELPDEL